VRAILFDRHGGPEVLEEREVPEPPRAGGEVLVRIRAAAVNHFDLDLRRGTSGLDLRLPHQLGLEGTGEIAWAEDASSFRGGERVIVGSYASCHRCEACLSGLPNLCENLSRPGVERSGTYADIVSVPEELLDPIPEGVTFEEAAGIASSFGTAHHALVVRARMRPGEAILVTGAAGGVGSALVQLAKLGGAYVIALVGSDAKAEVAKELGADAVAVGEDALNEAIGPFGGAVDIIVDGGGGTFLERGLSLLRPRGRYVVYGAHAGVLGRVDVMAFFRSYVSLVASTGWTRADMGRVLDLLGRGRIRLLIHDTLPLSEAARAHALLEGRRVFGKILLRPGA